MENYELTKRIPTISELIKKLADIQSDFQKNSIAENKSLLETINEVEQLIHGRRSFNVLNYKALDIEVELRIKENKVRLFTLQQIIEAAEAGNFDREPLKVCWDEFIFAKELDYGSGGGSIPGWSSHGLALKAKGLMFKIVLNKLLTNLKKGLGKKTKEEFIRMLQGLKARYNQSTEEYKIIDKSLKKFDPNDIYAHNYI